MQNAGAPDEAIQHLMGHKTSTYSKWLNRKEELLDIYKRSHPGLDEKTAVEQVIEYANSLGLNLDPKVVIPLKGNGNIEVHANVSAECENTAGA